MYIFVCGICKYILHKKLYAHVICLLLSFMMCICWLDYSSFCQMSAPCRLHAATFFVHTFNTAPLYSCLSGAYSWQTAHIYTHKNIHTYICMYIKWMRPAVVDCFFGCIHIATIFLSITISIIIVVATDVGNAKNVLVLCCMPHTQIFRYFCMCAFCTFVIFVCWFYSTFYFFYCCFCYFNSSYFILFLLLVVLRICSTCCCSLLPRHAFAQQTPCSKPECSTSFVCRWFIGVYVFA